MNFPFHSTDLLYGNVALYIDLKFDISNMGPAFEFQRCNVIYNVHISTKL